MTKNKRLIIFIALIAIIIPLLISVNHTKPEGEKMSENVYDFRVQNIDKEEINLAEYKGKVLLIVNVASKCGYTPQYAGLQKLYSDYKDKGFEILAFPCNQFGRQEPGTNEEIKEFCSTNYSVTFPLFNKIKVNGKDAHPLYKFLKKRLPGTMGTEAIKWNFTKFLIDKSGTPVKRFGSATKPDSIRGDIEKLLAD